VSTLDPYATGRLYVFIVPAVQHKVGGEVNDNTCYPDRLPEGLLTPARRKCPTAGVVRERNRKAADGSANVSMSMGRVKPSSARCEQA